jgi:archaellum component FlaC
MKMAGRRNVDSDLREYLDGMKAEMTGMKAELKGMKAEMTGVKAELKGMKAEMTGMKAELKADIERVETALLTEFHKWASPAEARARTHTATLRAIDLEMEVLSERMQKLEDR